MGNTAHFKKYSVIDGDVRVDLDMGRFGEQFARAQYRLDGNIMNSMVPFMPHLNGTFIQATRSASAAVQGTGQVYAAYGVQGRYLYEGRVMVDSETGKGPMKIPMGPGGDYILRFRRGAVLAATDRPLRYTKTHNPAATGHWFDAAKQKDGKEWVEDAKRTAGGGQR